jgi:cellulose synthase/poly-beta-1,6-N-acetylglucosamine synthase-like glycosyltransferase
MGKEKVSFITTVLNEENSIDQFLSSIYFLSFKPDEVIIVDAGSTDGTLKIINNFKRLIRNLKVIVKKNITRSAGRNLAISMAKNQIIAMSDSGCILDKDWLLEITRPFSDPKIEVVAGYYRADSQTVFEECVAPYVLVMPDKINPDLFLPSSRSMAIRKNIWKKFNGFPENYNESEDYLFSIKLKKGGAKIVFNQNAVVSWRPRQNLPSFFKMIYKFAKSDSRAGLRRFKVATIFLRYVLYILLCFTAIIFRGFLVTAVFLALIYIFWSIWKNYKYVQKWQAIIILPILQIVSDFAVIFGSIKGGIESE